jgi:flagellar biosynthesis/type III secretory pathway protein FliH
MVNEVLDRAVNDAITTITKDILENAGLPQSHANGATDEYAIPPRAQSEGASQANIERLLTKAREEGYQNGWEAGKKIGYMQGFEKGKATKTTAREKRWAAEGFDEGNRVGFVEGRKIGKEKGLKFGVAEGIKEAARENAKKNVAKNRAVQSDLMEL